MSAQLARPLMDADEFLAWTATLDDGARYELLRGEPQAMAPELLSHGEIKTLTGVRLFNAIEAAGLPCRVLVDSVGVRPNQTSFFIPDVLVQCGPRPPEGREIADPIIVVEIESPSTAWKDNSTKVLGYFSIPSVRHYLIVSPRDRAVIHHERRTDGVIETHLCGEGAIRLDPPGLVLSDIFPPADPAA